MLGQTKFNQETIETISKCQVILIYC